MSGSDATANPPINLQPELRRRLVVVRHMLAAGDRERRQPDPLNALSLLALHDAAEWLLLIVADALGVRAKELLDLWDRIDVKLAARGLPGLPLRPQMTRLSRTRGRIKHDGVLPSRHDADEHWSFGKAFLNDSTRLLFGIDLEAVSMAGAISDEHVRTFVLDAEAALQRGDLEACQQACVLGLATLLSQVAPRFLLGAPVPQALRSPSILRGMALPESSSSERSLKYALLEFEREIVRELQTVERNFNDVAERLTMLELGLDFDAYRRFRRLVPRARSDAKGERVFFSGPAVTNADARFCIDFVINSALTVESTASELSNAAADATHPLGGGQ